MKRTSIFPPGLCGKPKKGMSNTLFFMNLSPKLKNCHKPNHKKLSSRRKDEIQNMFNNGKDSILRHLEFDNSDTENGWKEK
mmetsp:Transcript_31473/g.27835  ORF Transcript_31473/g.27835 Transcript_31473/m.27835 type:complete len:81 (-) Transcript_31473:611-853(-)